MDAPRQRTRRPRLKLRAREGLAQRVNFLGVSFAIVISRGRGRRLQVEFTGIDAGQAFTK